MKTKLIWVALIVVALSAATAGSLMADEPAPLTAEGQTQPTADQPIPLTEDRSVRVTLVPSAEELRVGDPVQLTLEVITPAGYQVIIPKLEPDWGPFEVRNQSPTAVEAADDGSQTTKQVIEVTVYNLGSFETPTLQLTVRDAAGQILQETTPSVSLNVIPTLAEDDSDLRDIKPQASLQVPLLWPWLAAGLVAAVAMVLVGWWAYRRSQGKPFGLRRAPDNRPPWQVAYDELERIEGLRLVEQGSFKQHYTLVTDCLRTYLEKLLDTQVYDRTTLQLRAVLKRSELEPDHARQVLDLLSESDLVKFAKLTPDDEVARQLVARVRMLVDDTRPTPELEQAPNGSIPPAATTAASQLGYLSEQ
jgi:hypothetical protein